MGGGIGALKIRLKYAGKAVRVDCASSSREVVHWNGVVRSSVVNAKVLGQGERIESCRKKAFVDRVVAGVGTNAFEGAIVRKSIPPEGRQDLKEWSRNCTIGDERALLWSHASK